MLVHLPVYHQPVIGAHMHDLSEGSSTCNVGHLWVGFSALKSTTENFPSLSLKYEFQIVNLMVI